MNILYPCKFYSTACTRDTELRQAPEQIPPVQLGADPSDRHTHASGYNPMALSTAGTGIKMKSWIIYDCISKANIVYLKVIAAFILETFKCLKYFKQAWSITPVKHMEKLQKAWLKLPILHIADFKKKTKW